LGTQLSLQRERLSREVPLRMKLAFTLRAVVAATNVDLARESQGVAGERRWIVESPSHDQGMCPIGTDRGDHVGELLMGGGRAVYSDAERPDGLARADAR
jgi:hypothetical protein